MMPEHTQNDFDIDKVRAALRAIPSRRRDQTETRLKELAADILESLNSHKTRKAIREALAKNGLKVSPTKFKIFLETHVLPKMPKTSGEALTNARAMAKGRQE